MYYCHSKDSTLTREQSDLHVQAHLTCDACLLQTETPETRIGSSVTSVNTTGLWHTETWQKTLYHGQSDSLHPGSSLHNLVHELVPALWDSHPQVSSSTGGQCFDRRTTQWVHQATPTCFQESRCCVLARTSAPANPPQPDK